MGGLYCLQGKITTPDLLTVQFDFARCPVVWRHRIWGAGYEEYVPELSNSILFYGEKATVYVADFAGSSCRTFRTSNGKSTRSRLNWACGT